MAWELANAHDNLLMLSQLFADLSQQWLTFIIKRAREFGICLKLRNLNEFGLSDTYE